MHNLSVGDICRVTSGKHGNKIVLVIKDSIPTKFGVRALVVQYFDTDNIGDETIWLPPEFLVFLGQTESSTAKARAEDDYNKWKTKKYATSSYKLNKKSRFNGYQKRQF